MKRSGINILYFVIILFIVSCNDDVKIDRFALVSGPISLFLQHKGDLMAAGKPVGYGGTSQVASANYINAIELDGLQVNLQLPSDYIVKSSPVYWIRKGEEWFSFNGEKQFLKIFPDKANQIKGFIKENRIKFDKSENLVKLVKYCSTL
jgi:hypothetical protein